MKKIWRVIFSIGLSVTMMSFYQQNPNKASYENGKTVYSTYCQSCHMEDGNGVPSAFPSLVKTGRLADKNKLAKIILQGLRGKHTVNGIDYDGEMAPIAITDQEVADVINYIRNSWGNKAPYIKLADVVAAKKATVKGYQPY